MAKKLRFYQCATKYCNKDPKHWDNKNNPTSIIVAAHSVEDAMKVVKEVNGADIPETFMRAATVSSEAPVALTGTVIARGLWYARYDGSVPVRA